MRAQTDFTDYDFDGSVLSNLLDGRITHTTLKFNTNMVVNELFLDSATLRDNVILLQNNWDIHPSQLLPSAASRFYCHYTNNPPEFIDTEGNRIYYNYDDSTYQLL